MTWRLSALIGSPEFRFLLLRPSRDNFFVDVLHAFEQATGMSELTGSTGDLVATTACAGTAALVALVIGAAIGSRSKIRQKMPVTRPSASASEPLSSDSQGEAAD